MLFRSLELRAAYSSSILTITTADREGLKAAAAELGGTIESAEGAVVRIGVETAETARLILARHGTSVQDFEFRHGTMDDVFLALTGRETPAPAEATEGAGK